MASSRDERGQVNYARRFFWFALAIAVAGLVYTGGWYYAADRLVSEVNARVAAVNGDGRRASCENAEARGYPFRIGVFCRSVMFEDARRGLRFRAKELRTVAQVYQPHRLIAELDGPASIEVPGVNALDVSWETMRASMRYARPLPERTSLAGMKVEVRLADDDDSSPAVATAETAEFHVRPAGKGVDVAARFSGLMFDPELVGTDTLPPLSGLVDIVLDELGSEPRGRSGTVRTIAVNVDAGTGATISGPVAIDADGLIDAQLEIILRNPRAIGQILADALPESRREIELGVSGLAALGETPTLPLSITKSRVRLGFISLGTIPPI